MGTGRKWLKWHLTPLHCFYLALKDSEREGHCRAQGPPGWQLSQRYRLPEFTDGRGRVERIQQGKKKDVIILGNKVITTWYWEFMEIHLIKYFIHHTNLSSYSDNLIRTLLESNLWMVIQVDSLPLSASYTAISNTSSPFLDSKPQGNLSYTFLGRGKRSTMLPSNTKRAVLWKAARCADRIV